MELPAAVAADVLQHIVGGQPSPEQVAAFQSLHKVQLRAVEDDQAASLRQLQADLAGTIRVWLLDGTHKKTFKLHTDHVFALVALPDNRHALSGGNDIKLFNVNDGGVLRTFKHHTGRVYCLALLPDGLRFVSGSDDETACIVEHGLAPFAA